MPPLNNTTSRLSSTRCLHGVCVTVADQVKHEFNKKAAIICFTVFFGTPLAILLVWLVWKGICQFSESGFYCRSKKALVNMFAKLKINKSRKTEEPEVIEESKSVDSTECPSYTSSDSPPIYEVD